MSEENIAQMRETIERLSKDKAGLEKTVAEQVTQLRVFAAKEAFRSAGYNPNNGALYAAVNPEGDITEDSVVKFAEEQGLALVPTGTQDSDADAQESTSKEATGQSKLAAMAGGGSGAGDGGAGSAASQALTRAEWRELHSRDRSAAMAAVASGRVQISKDNVYAEGKLAPGTNPFVPKSTDT